MRTVGAVIVTWNSGETIGRCIESCSGLEVIVIDNASSDDTAESVRRHPEVAFISNLENRGFAAAVNQGIERTSSDYILLLNPDVELLTPLTALVEACAAGDVAIAAGRLLNPNGVTQTGFTIRALPTPAALAFEALGINRLFPSNSVNRHYRCLDFPLETARDVEQPAGAFMLFKRDLWSRLGGFDERFSPVWFEDVDFCKRALEIGRIRYLPDVAAKHHGGASVRHMEWSKRELCWYGSLLRYASKHFSRFKFRGVCGAVVLGSAVRLLTGLFVRRTSQVITVYAKTAGLAAQCLILGRVSPARWEGRQHTRVRTITSSTK
jgi:hypothetical protein